MEDAFEEYVAWKKREQRLWEYNQGVLSTLLNICICFPLQLDKVETISRHPCGVFTETY